MLLKTEHAAYLYIRAFVDELARAGVKHICVCPGSRSTPLALMLADHSALKLWLHLDERSAAFFALGLAKAQRAPVALLCTSGTAAANFLPAIVEAHYARVPLIVLTADRPPELRDMGAPQTIDQIKLYGDYAKWFVEMALPEATAEMMRYARTMACRAVSECTATPAGVAHLNFPLREPLVPLPTEIQFAEHEREAYEGRANNQPYATVTTPPQAIDAEAIAHLRAELAHIERGLIIAGPQTDPDFPAAVARLSAVLGYPILADPLSQVRCGAHSLDNVIDGYDAFLREAAVVEHLKPEVVLRFGAMPTSKPVLVYLQHHPNCRQILIDDSGWNDPTKLVGEVIRIAPSVFCDALITQTTIETAWLKLWRTLNQRTRQIIATHFDTNAELFEGQVFAELAALLPQGATCWASSSMPVRDLDTFFPASARSIQFLANRGANGIDGVVSSALGASVVAQPLVLVIGDIALYHDMNGLLAAKLHQLNATIVLLNNDGGGIFSFLPQAAHPKHFEQLFGTPHGLDFRPVAELYGATFARPHTWVEFRTAVQQGLQSTGLHIVEVQTNRPRNVDQHRAIWPKVAAAVKEVVETTISEVV